MASSMDSDLLGPWQDLMEPAGEKKGGTVKSEIGGKDLSILEQEVEGLKQVLWQQNHLIQQMANCTNTNKPPRTATKPRDIPILELHHLQGLNATTQLQIFIELVEQSSTEDTHRVQIAKSRVSGELAALIHNQQTLHNCYTWNQLKQLLLTKFSKEVNFDRAWREIDAETYDWVESPQVFANKFTCKYATLETGFPQDKLPKCDKIIKRKLWQGLTQEAKARVEGFLDEDYPLDKFIDRVENERQLLEATHTAPISRIKHEPAKSSPKPANNSNQHNPNASYQTNATSSESKDIRELKQQIKSLTEQVGKLGNSPSPPPPTKYCKFCKTNNHTLMECWRKPARGTCFDCRRYGCWRGNTNCPRRPNQSI